MRVWILGSGSRGNAIVLDAGRTRVLVDCGYPPRTLAGRMRACGIAPESVCALIITHEHGDHVRGAAKGASKWGWTVYASAGTARASRRLSGASTFRAGAALHIGDVTVQTVRIAHDAADPVALVACDERSGIRAAIAHDLGAPTDALRRAISGVDVLVLEANHDEGMLRAGPYPPFLQARISGGRGHLSNRFAAGLARQTAHAGLRDVVLAHLSEQNNTPATAHRAVAAALRGTRFRGRLTPAAQDAPCGPFGPAAKAAVSRQLALAL